jgi:hypothetical protein
MRTSFSCHFLNLISPTLHTVTVQTVINDIAGMRTAVLETVLRLELLPAPFAFPLVVFPGIGATCLVTVHPVYVQHFTGLTHLDPPGELF